MSRVLVRGTAEWRKVFQVHTEPIPPYSSSLVIYLTTAESLLQLHVAIDCFTKKAFWLQLQNWQSRLFFSLPSCPFIYSMFFVSTQSSIWPLWLWNTWQQLQDPWNSFFHYWIGFCKIFYHDKASDINSKRQQFSFKYFKPLLQLNLIVSLCMLLMPQSL